MSVLYFKNEDGEFVEVPTLRGRSAYGIAVELGFQGTKEEWLESLRYALTEDDKTEIAALVKASMTTENVVCTLEDGTTVLKAVYVE